MANFENFKPNSPRYYQRFETEIIARACNANRLVIFNRSDGGSAYPPRKFAACGIALYDRLLLNACISVRMFVLVHNLG
jgi:hypothetical protein